MQRIILPATILTIMLIGLGLAGARAATNTNPQRCTSDYAQSADELSLLTSLNTYRKDNGLLPVARSWALTKAAQWKANHMAKAQYLAHDDPAPVSRTWEQRLTACAVQYVWAGENIAGACPPDNCDPLVVFQNSPTHNAVLLNPNYTAVGIAYVPGDSGQQFHDLWVMDFSSTAQGWSTCADVADASGYVYLQDLNNVVERYGTSDLSADITEDGHVLIDDVQFVVKQYGTYCTR